MNKMEDMFKVPVETIYNKIDVINIRFSMSSLCGWKIEKPFDTKIVLRKPDDSFTCSMYTYYMFKHLCEVIADRGSISVEDIKSSITVKLYGVKHSNSNKERASRFTKMKYGIRVYNVDEIDGKYLYAMISYIVRHHNSDCKIIFWR